jgi:hypothetical protein
MINAVVDSIQSIIIIYLFYKVYGNYLWSLKSFEHITSVLEKIVKNEKSLEDALEDILVLLRELRKKIDNGHHTTS